MNIRTLYKGFKSRKYYIKYLGSLTIILFGFTCFSNAQDYDVNWNTEIQVGGKNFVKGDCILVGSTTRQRCNFKYNDGTVMLSGAEFTSNAGVVCFNTGGLIDCNGNNSTYTFFFHYNLCEECPECEQCPEIDTNYCVNNDLCPIPSNFSNLFINNIEHQSAPYINITIPEEIQRDSNVDSGEFNLDIVGYGYNQDKMQSIVNTQYYKPTPEEMSGLIEKIADFLPLIAIALLVIWIRRVIKKVFKL